MSAKYDRYCDHDWIRDDETSFICKHCHRRKEVSGDAN